MSAVDTYAKRIQRAYDRTDDATRQEGLDWYQEGQDIVRDLAERSGYSVEQIACACAHLSARQQWTTNVRALRALVQFDERYPSIMRSSFERARLALRAEDPWSTFGKRALKTRNFARNLSGDLSTVAVDIWVIRLLGLPVANAATPSQYRDAVKAFNRVAKRLGIEPAALQAIVWCDYRRRNDHRTLAAIERKAS